MAGTVVRLGRYRTTSGPDLAVVYYDDQLASHTNPASHASRLILYEAGSWVGRYSGIPVARIVLLDVASGRPNSPVAYTNEFSPSVGYTGAGGGQSMTVALTTPYLTTANYAYTVGLMNSHASAILGVAMFQAADIVEGNESFYRKDNFGTTPVAMSGATETNEGQLVAWFNGEVNVKPNDPTGLSPSGTYDSTNKTPTLTANFSDPNETLTNGVEWDELTSTRVWLRTGSTAGPLVWSDEWNNTASEKTARKSSIVCGTTLVWGTTYYYGAQHKDRGGEWSDVVWTSFTILDPNDPPLAPDTLTPSGSVVSSLTPSLKFRHRDPNSHNSSKAQVEVQTSAGAARWLFDWAVSAAHNAYISRTYAGTALVYGTAYRFRAKTWDSAGYEGPWSDWTTFTLVSPNTAPDAPDTFAPVGTVTGGLTPTLSMRHRDPDGNNSSNANIQVRRKSDSTSMLDKTWATVVAHNGTVSTSYNGLTLAYNTTYQIRGRTQDSAGAWGAYSTWADFTITSLASVDKPTSPAGYQAGTTPADVIAVYRHNNGVAAQAFRAQLLNATGSVIATSGWINKTVAVDATVTLTWAELGFTARAWGASEQVQVQARDANAVVAPAYSPAQQYNINAAPSVPSGLTPNGTAHAARPILVVANVTDADTVQDPKSSLVVKAVLTTNAGTFTVTLPWVAARSRWEFQTTATELPTQTTFLNQWQAYAYDGSVYSGETTVEASASKSAVATFYYDAVPEVTVNGPVSPIETSQPTLTWLSNQAQTKYRAYGYMGTELVYDSGLVTSAVLSHQVVPGNFLNNHAWNTGETIDWEVSVTNASSLVGTSPRFSVLLQYTPPTTLLLSGESMSLPQTTQANAMAIWHNATDVPNESFEGYVWRRVAIEDDGTPIPGSEVVLAVVMNPGATQLIDAEIAANQHYRWTVTVRERRDNDIVESAPSIFEGSVSWDGIVMHIPHDPMNTAVEIAFGTGNGAYKPMYQWTRRSQDYEAVSGDRIFSLGKKLHTDASGTFEIMDDETATAEQRLATLNYAYRLQSGEIDGLPHTACWRSGRGGVNAIVYGMLTDDPVTDWDEDGWYELSIGIRSAAYTLGVQGGI